MAFHSEASFRLLPRELQRKIINTYLGDSYANLCYINAVFAGNDDMRVLIAESFTPKITAIYFDPDVMDKLRLSTEYRSFPRLTIRRILRATAPGSGVMMAVFDMVGSHTDWLEGELLFDGPTVDGLMEVVEYRSSTTRWEFQTAHHDEWVDDFCGNRR